MTIDNEIKIEVKANLSVSEETANVCMKLLEFYCRDNDKTVQTFIENKIDGELGQAELAFSSLQSFLKNKEEIRSLYDEHYKSQRKGREVEE